ncbi:MAG: peptide chain release factor N(5)-glutamine methyltransferase [Burkholderiaceae bacterium]
MAGGIVPQPPDATPPDAPTHDALIRACGLPRLEARVLLAHASGRSREWLIGHGDAAAPPAVADAFAALCARRAAGTPIAYLLGWREFHGRRFDVDESVLIPRPETELLVERSLARLDAPPAAGEAPAVLELGTGSGCIAVTLAAERADLRLVATDGSAAALDTARRNARRHGVAARIDFRLSAGGTDWWTPIGADERFALIVSNPPYVARDDAHLRDGDPRFEPRSALTDRSDDGLASISLIVAGAAGRLRPGGWLLLEHGFDQGAAVRARLRDAGFGEVATLADLAGHDRVTVGRRTG